MLKLIHHYFRDVATLNILTASAIYSCLIPAVLTGMVITIYQAICLPVYKIPKVNRRSYIVIGWSYLSYLNGLEKMNCVYCGYFNSLIGFAQEIAARTGQYWCPIKHARKIRFVHSRYSKLPSYEDGVSCRENLESIRRAFDDLR